MLTLTGSRPNIGDRLATEPMDHPATTSRFRRIPRNARNDCHVKIGLSAPTLRSGRAWREAFFGSPKAFGASWITLFLLLVTSLVPERADGQSSAFLVSDIVRIGAGSYPCGLRVVGDVLYFTANDTRTGKELWRSDGTADGTRLVKDINPGESSYYSGETCPRLVTFGERLLFAADDGSSGTELWISDGTEFGTRLIADVNPGPSDSRPQPLGRLDQRYLFLADDGITGSELWSTDGTADETFLVKDITPGQSGSDVSSALAWGNALLFVVNDQLATGDALWRSDGSRGGAVLIKSLPRDFFASAPSRLTVVGDTAFFAAHSSEDGRELWRTDGTDAGTFLVRDINPGPSGSDPSLLLNFDGTLYFLVDLASGRQLWRSDGTFEGTRHVRAISTDAAEPPYFFGREAITTNSLIFFTNVNDAGRIELWESDGSDVGTTIVRDFDATDAHRQFVAVDPLGLSILGDVVLFSPPNASTGRELWRTDGTVAGTFQVADIGSGSLGGLDFTSQYRSGMAELNGILLFAADDGTSGAELWKTDGTATGTELVMDLNRTEVGSSPREMLDVSGTLFFTAGANGLAQELWRTDGARAVRLHDFGGDPQTFPGPHLLGARGGRLLFAADDGISGFELWTSDGTEAGTARLVDINPGPSPSINPYSLKGSVSNRTELFFVADDGTYGRELWKSDGTGNGTLRAHDIRAGSSGSDPRELTILNGDVYFAANDGERGEELWRSDGSSAGTFLVRDISQGSSSPQGLTPAKDTLFFAARDRSGYELWRTDGTAAGTAQVRDINKQGSFFLEYFPQLAYTSDVLFLVGDDGNVGTELWRSDGTETGTILIRDINPGAAHSYPSSLVALNGLAFFLAEDGSNGRQLWKSDGTEAGTSIVRHLSGILDYFPFGLTAIGPAILFTANDGLTGYELWRSDGTPEGTRPIVDIAPGALSSNPGPVTVSGTNLYFSGDDRSRGVELWALSLCDTGACGGDCNASGTIGVNELVTLLNIVLGHAPWSSCVLGDVDCDGAIAVNEIVRGVNHLLEGCQ